MKFLNDNYKIRTTQIISYITFSTIVIARTFPEYLPLVSPYNIAVLTVFFVAQGFMIYFFIQEKKTQAKRSE